MGNHTVNKKIGKAAGIKDITRITGMSIRQEKELIAEGKIDRGNLMTAGEFVSIKAYPGGNPKRAKRKEEEITH